MTCTNAINLVSIFGLTAFFQQATASSLSSLNTFVLLSCNNFFSSNVIKVKTFKTKLYFNPLSAEFIFVFLSYSVYLISRFAFFSSRLFLQQPSFAGKSLTGVSIYESKILHASLLTKCIFVAVSLAAVL